MRADSSSMRRMMTGRSTRARSSPSRKSSAKPWIEVSGVRSSWEASARNWRRRCSVASRSAKAASISPSMVLRARPSWPTSVRPSLGLTRPERLPAVMERAEVAICSSGRRPRRQDSHAPAASRASRASPAEPSMSTRPAQRRRHLGQGHGHDDDGAAPARDVGGNDEHTPSSGPRDGPGVEQARLRRVESCCESGLGGRARQLDATSRDELARPVAQLGVGARRHDDRRPSPRRLSGVGSASAGARAARATRGLEARGLPELPGDERHRSVQLLVEALILRAGIELVGCDTEHREPGGDQSRERDDETEPEGHAPVLGGLRITRRSCPTDAMAGRTTASPAGCRRGLTAGVLAAGA